MPAYDVIIKKIEPLRVAEVRGVAPSMAEIGPTLDGLFDRVAGFVKQNGGKLGVGITSYYDEELSETNVNVGAAMAYNGAATSTDHITVHELPGWETVASTIHRGSFAGLSQAYQAISQWIEANGYRVVGPNRELNLEYERGGDQSKYVTEIQFPVEKQ